MHELRTKLQTAGDQVKRLPGTDYSQQEQIQQLDSLRAQLNTKTNLLLKYRNMCNFDLPERDGNDK